MNKIKDIIGDIDVMKGINEDQTIESESAKLNYLDLVTENLRANNKKIARNSFWMLLSILLYILILREEESIKDIQIFFVTINDNILLLNLIPVFFAFVFLQNMALWNNNINLTQIFDDLAIDLYRLGLLTDTKNIIRPFTLMLHVSNYQLNNKRIFGLFKFPSFVMFVAVMVIPIFFIYFSIWRVIDFDAELSLIPFSCSMLTGALGISSVLQAFSTYKEIKK